MYKLVAVDGRPKLKVTSDIAKATLPGMKRLLRGVGPAGEFIQDVICLEDDIPGSGDTVYDPCSPLLHTRLPENVRLLDLRRVVMTAGRRTTVPESLEVMAERSGKELAHLPQGCLRFINPHRYKVSITGRLNELRNRLISEAPGQGV